MTPDHKICKGCGEDKPLSEYRKQKLGLYGHRSRCRSCIAVEDADYRERTDEQRRAYNAGYRAKNREAVRAYNRGWNRANRERIAIAAFRFAAKKRGHKPGDLYYLSIEKLQARYDFYAGRCAYCGNEATTFDHRIALSNGGQHLPANLLPACRSCNCRKWRKPERQYREEVRLTHG